jgi:hypothetical protein
MGDEENKAHALPGLSSGLAHLSPGQRGALAEAATGFDNERSRSHARSMHGAIASTQPKPA